MKCIIHNKITLINVLNSNLLTILNLLSHRMQAFQNFYTGVELVYSRVMDICRIF